MINITISDAGIAALVFSVIFICVTSMWNVWNIVRHK